MNKLKLTSESDFETENESEDEEEDVLISDNSNSLMKIRSVFSKIKRSEVLFIKLQAACETADIESCVKPVLDCPTRWNSTHDMLGTALKMKNGINTICCAVEDFKKFRLTEEEWDILEKIYKFLQNFKKLSTKLGGESYITLSLVIPAFNLLIDRIEEKISQLRQSETRIDIELAFAFQSCRDKMLKHYKMTNWVYCITLILDPRHKLEVFDMTTWGQEMKPIALAKFKNIFHKYIENNVTLPYNSPPRVSTKFEEEDVIDFEQLYAKSSTSTAIISQTLELDVYLSEERSNYCIDILQWWKLHETRFPQLARMAKDFLAIPATSVPAERVFSRASLTMRKHRNKLSDETARWLLCINIWAN